jgi:transcriptional regulator with XRE-family HTH domain
MGIEDWSESRRGLSVDLSRVLADLRIGAGWTQVELALRMGVNDATVGSWEHGVAGVPAARLPQMAQVLRLSLHDLTYGAPWRRTGRPARAKPEPPSESVQERLFGAGMTSERGPRDVIGVCLQCGENYPIQDRRPRLRRCGRCHGQVLVEAA